VIAEGRELTGSAGDRAGPTDGDQAGARVITLIGTRLGVASSNSSTSSTRRSWCIGGGVIAAGDLLLQPARDEVAVRALRAQQGTIVRIVPAHFGNEAGMLGAAGHWPSTASPVARPPGREHGRRRPPGRLPDADRNLEDVTLRVLSALRDADVLAWRTRAAPGCCWNRYGVQARLVSYHEHNERARGAGVGQAHAAGATWRSSRPQGMPLVSDPGFCARAGLRGRGAGVEVLPGPSAALAALVASACPPSAGALPPGFAAQEGDLRALAGRSDRDAPGVRVARRRVAASLAGGWPSSDPRSPGRGSAGKLTKAPRGGRARSAADLGGGANGPNAAPRGEVCSSSGALRGFGHRDERAADAVRRLVDAGRSRGRPSGAWASLTGASPTRCTARLNLISSQTAEDGVGVHSRQTFLAVRLDDELGVAGASSRRPAAASARASSSVSAPTSS